MSGHGQLDRLAIAVRAAVARRTGWLGTARLVASGLERHLPSPSILSTEQRAGDPERFRSHVLHSEPDGSFSIVALVWRPRQMTRIHDHVTWGAFAVIQVVEHEELFTLDEEGACPHRHLDSHLRDRRRPARFERTARLRPPRAARQGGCLS